MYFTAGDGSLALCNVRRGRGRPRRNAAGNLLTADCLPAAAGQTQLQEGTLAVYTGAPASGPLLMGSGFDCKDGTRAIIEEMLQKDRDLETAQSHRKYLTEKVQVTNAKLEACEATKGQLATQVPIFHSRKLIGRCRKPFDNLTVAAVISFFLCRWHADWDDHDACILPCRDCTQMYST